MGSPLGGGTESKDRLKEGAHIRPGRFRFGGGVTLSGRCVQHGKIQLLRIRGQFQEQVLDHLDHLCHPGLGAVYLVNDHHGGDALAQGLAQHIGSLGHGPVYRVHQ